MEPLQAEHDERGRALVVRNGKARERKVTLGAGTITQRAPRVSDRRPQCRFSSKILPPEAREQRYWVRKRRARSSRRSRV